MLSFWGVLYLGDWAAFPSLYFSLAKWHTSWNHIICAGIANHSVNNWITRKLWKFACMWLPLIPVHLIAGSSSILFSWRRRRKQGQEGKYCQGSPSQFAWTHFCMALALCICLLGCLFQSSLPQAFFLPLIFFFPSLLLCSCLNFFLLSLSSTPLPPRGQSIGPESCW
jgi:hypothetical protein